MGDAFIFGPWALFATLAFANLVQRVAGVDGTACKEHAKAGSLLQARRSMAMIDGEDFVPEAGWNHTTVVVAPQYVASEDDPLEKTYYNL